MVLMIPQFPIPILDLLDMISGILHLLMFPHLELNIMAETVDGKKDEADYKRLHSFPLIRVKTVA